MTCLLDIDFLSDEPLRRRLALWSAGILAACVTLIALLVVLGVLPGETEASALLGGSALAWLVAIAAVSLLALPVHELVHGVLFRVLGGPGTRVTYGHAAGMLYAGCPGLVLARARFCVVLLGPAVGLTAALVAVPALLGYPLLGAIAAALHLSSCAGDLLAAFLALRKPACTHVQDTEAGVRLLAAARG